jgi:putative FmdB family regulatory protein
MPIYAYRCSACGHAKDVLQKMSDPLLHTCPACGAESFTKQLTAAGFQLKGSGWYATDFKGSGAAPAKDGKEGKDGKDGKDGEAKSTSTDQAAATPAADKGGAAAAPAPAAPAGKSGVGAAAAPSV